MGFFSALFGQSGVMACTWAVESVVTEHLKSQLSHLGSKQDVDAYNAVHPLLKMR